ncbi:MAG: ABC transporter substrate-binding protein [Betaproteobacteria bacterium]
MSTMVGAVVAAAIALSTAAMSVTAQPAERIPLIGYLGFLGEPEQSHFREAFLAGLRDAGYVPGQNLVIEARRYSSEGELRNAIADLSRLKAAVLVVGPPGTAATARHATQNVPIVCASCGDPVENGLAASLARPGGMVTGVASLSAELLGKRLAQLKEMLPGTTRIAAAVFPRNPGTAATLKALESAGRVLGLEILRVEVRGAADVEPVFRAAAAGKASAMLLQDDPMLRTVRAQIGSASLKYRIPASTGVPEVAEAGALIAYGPDRVAMMRRTATFVDRILKGAKPGELPFEQVAKLDLIVNARTAKALGIVIPPAIVLQASRVIE